MSERLKATRKSRPPRYNTVDTIATEEAKIVAEKFKNSTTRLHTWKMIQPICHDAITSGIHRAYEQFRQAQHTGQDFDNLMQHTPILSEKMWQDVRYSIEGVVAAHIRALTVQSMESKVEELQKQVVELSDELYDKNSLIERYKGFATDVALNTSGDSRQLLIEHCIRRGIPTPDGI